MAGRERSGARAALSRLPRWVTVLGIVLVLAVLAGTAAVLAIGTSGLEGRLGLTRTVVLRIYAEPRHPVDTILCNPHSSVTTEPGCNPYSPFSGLVWYNSPTSGGSYQYTAPSTDRYTVLHTWRVRVPVGGFVTLDSTGGGSGAEVVGCSILLDGRVLSRHISTFDSPGGPTCQARIPSGLSP